MLVWFFLLGDKAVDDDVDEAYEEEKDEQVHACSEDRGDDFIGECSYDQYSYEDEDDEGVKIGLSCEKRGENNPDDDAESDFFRGGDVLVGGSNHVFDAEPVDKLKNAFFCNEADEKGADEDQGEADF